MPSIKARWLILALGAILPWAVICESAMAAALAPGKRVEIVVPANPGGGLDTVGRIIERIVREERLLEQPVIVNNVPGAGGDVGKAYLFQKKGDPHYLLVDSARVYQNKLLGTTPVGLEEVTPVARVLTDYLVWAVRADSPIRSAREVLERLKADPGSVSFGVGSAPSSDYFNIVRPAMAQGIDHRKLRIVVFKSGGDLMTQLLGGHVAVLCNTVSETIEQVKAGNVRLLSSSAPEAMGGSLQGVPHWRGMGIDVTIRLWRGVFLPPGVSGDAVKQWEDVLSRIVNSETWRTQMQRNGWFDAYQTGAVFRKELETERDAAAKLLRELGFIKQ